MASFSFAAGNAAKLLRLPLYAVGRVATALIPRSRDQWVFGCAVGVTDGALALWRVADAAGEATWWLTADDAEREDARSRGIRPVAKNSVAGFWRTARARVVVVTHGFGDVNRYAVAGAYVVQLWHGIPLKRIGLDAPETTRSAILPRSRVMRAVVAAAYRRAQSHIRLLPAASHLVRGRLESAFGLTDAQVPVTGEPRTDVLLRGTPDERRASARADVARLCGVADPTTRVVLYAPTWRDGDPDPAVPTAAQWARIRALLAAHDAMLLIRSHPLGAGDYTPTEPDARIAMLPSSRVADVTPLLPGIDVLVTDYSSLVFDAALVPIPTVFLAPDLAEYGRRRGFYGRYGDVAGPDPATDWDGVVDRLAAVLGDTAAYDQAVNRARILSARVHDFHDGGSAQRVHRLIRSAALSAAPRREEPDAG